MPLRPAPAAGGGPARAAGRRAGSDGHEAGVERWHQRDRAVAAGALSSRPGSSSRRSSPRRGRARCCTRGCSRGTRRGVLQTGSEVVPKVPTSSEAEREARASLRLVKRDAKRGRDKLPDDAPPGWGELLKRVFGVDGWECPDCGKQMKLRTVVVGSPASTAIVHGLLRSTGPPAPRGSGEDQEVHASASTGLEGGAAPEPRFCAGSPAEGQLFRGGRACRARPCGATVPGCASRRAVHAACPQAPIRGGLPTQKVNRI